MPLTEKEADAIFDRAGRIMDVLHPLGVAVEASPKVDQAGIFDCALSTGETLEIDGDTAYLVRDGVRTRPWKDGDPMPEGWRPAS